MKSDVFMTGQVPYLPRNWMLSKLYKSLIWIEVGSTDRCITAAHSSGAARRVYQPTQILF